MKDLKFKVLVFKDDRFGGFGNVLQVNEGHELGWSEMPMLMMPSATLQDLKVIYPTLDLSNVEIKEVAIKILES